MYILYLILAVVILLTMVMIHEFGHYCAGKLLKFKINEFSIGFGKSLLSRKSKKTGEVFSLRLIPLGGYCAFEGEETDSDNKGAFNKQAPWKRLIVLFSGAFFNILSAIIFSIILLCATGYDIPRISSVDNIAVISQSVLQGTDKIVSVDGYAVNDDSALNLSNTIQVMIENNTITQKGNYDIVYSRTNKHYNTTISVEIENNSSVIKVGDVVTAVNGTKIDFIKNNLFSDLIQSAEGNTATLTINRDGEVQDVVVNLYNYGVGNDYKVIGVKSQAYKFTLGEAIVRSVPFTFGLAYKVLESLWLLISGQLGLSAVGGPITTISTIATFTQSNFASFFILLPLIAVNLGVFNLLPIPALDGSKMVFTTIEWIRGKPINPKVENAIHNIGFFILMGLVVVADLYHLLFL